MIATLLSPLLNLLGKIVMLLHERLKADGVQDGDEKAAAAVMFASTAIHHVRETLADKLQEAVWDIRDGVNQFISSLFSPPLSQMYSNSFQHAMSFMDPCLLTVLVENVMRDEQVFVRAGALDALAKIICCDNGRQVLDDIKLVSSSSSSTLPSSLFDLFNINLIHLISLDPEAIVRRSAFGVVLELVKGFGVMGPQFDCEQWR